MKNYLTTSLKSATTALYLLVLLCIGSTSLLGQSVVITSPAAPGPVTYCDLESTDVAFAITIEDEFDDPVPPTSVLKRWTGPNGFTSDLANPMVTFDSSTQSGDYIVTITFNGGQTVSDTLTVEVVDGITFTCPDEPLRIAAGDDCMPELDLNICLLYTSPSPRDRQKSRMPSSA